MEQNLQAMIKALQTEHRSYFTSLENTKHANHHLLTNLLNRNTELRTSIIDAHNKARNVSLARARAIARPPTLLIDDARAEDMMIKQRNQYNKFYKQVQELTSLKTTLLNDIEIYSVMAGNKQPTKVRKDYEYSAIATTLLVDTEVEKYVLPDRHNSNNNNNGSSSNINGIGGSIGNVAVRNSASNIISNNNNYNNVDINDIYEHIPVDNIFNDSSILLHNSVHNNSNHNSGSSSSSNSGIKNHNKPTQKLGHNTLQQKLAYLRNNLATQAVKVSIYLYIYIYIYT